MRETIMNDKMSILRRMLVSLLVLQALIGAWGLTSANAAEGVPFTSKPDIRLSRVDMKPVKANEEFVLSLNFENKSPAYSVNRAKVIVNPSDGLNIQDQSNIYFIDSTGIPVMGSNKVDVKLKASDRITTENLKLDVSLEYYFWGKDGMTSGTEIYTMFIPARKSESAVAKDNGVPIIQVVRGKISPIEEKKSYEFDIKIKNINEKVKAQNVKVTLSSAGGFTIKGNTSNYFIDEISSEDPFTIPVSIKANKTIEAESLDLIVNVSYFYKQGETSSQGNDSEKISIPSVPSQSEKKEKEEMSTLTPNIIVSSYNYGDKVEAGSTFDLSLAFKNTSKDTAVENIVVSMTTGEGISVASSSNSFYFDKLNAGSELPLKVEMKAWEEAKSAAAVITMNFNYEYRSNKSIVKGSTNESISILVVQPDRFEIGKVETVGLMAGEEGYISIPYVNKGKATTSNISAKVEGDNFEMISREIWVGNCNSGASGTIDLILTPVQAGDVRVKLLVEYEDPNGEKKKSEQEYSFYADEKMLPPSEDGEQEIIVPEETQNSKTKIIVISIAALIGLAVLIIVIKQIKKKANAKRMERLSHMYDWAVSRGEQTVSQEVSKEQSPDK